MADVENQQESSSFPVKRKSDLYHPEQDNNVANKAQKLNQSSNSADSESKDVEKLNSTNTDEKVVTLPEKVAEEEEEEEVEEEEDDAVEPVIERRGSISREDKGKGKMIEVEESEDDSEEDSDDDDDCGDEFDDESDLSDDPLAEVDLDNILPSRTRRRSIQPGVYFSNETRDRGVVSNEVEEEDDSDDDSDA